MIKQEEIYHQLRKEIDIRMPVGLPSVKNGIEIKILKLLFSPEEAKIVVHLSSLPEKLKTIREREIMMRRRTVSFCLALTSYNSAYKISTKTSFFSTTDC